MKAVFNGEHSNAKNMGNSKETIEERKVVVIHKGELKTPVDARWYMGKSNQASTVYCTVWVHGDKFCTSGHGSAGGYGYHKASAAFEDALDCAGVKLSKSISGVGNSAIDEALQTITRALGYRGKMVIV